MTLRHPVYALVVLLLAVSVGGACGEKYPCGGGGPAADLVRSFHHEVQRSLLPPPAVDDMSISGMSETVFAKSGEIADERLRGNENALRERAAWLLRCRLPQRSLPDTTAWEPVENVELDRLLLQFEEKLPSEGALRAAFWNPLTTAWQMKSLAESSTREGLQHAWQTLVAAVAPPEPVAVSRDPAAPVVAFVSANQILTISLEWKGGWYLPTKFEWLRRPAAGAPKSPAGE